MSDSRSDPAPRYACHCTFTVSATLSRSSGWAALYTRRLAQASPSTSVKRTTAPRGSTCDDSPPGPTISSQSIRSGAIASPARSTTPIASRAGTVGWCSARRTPARARARGRRRWCSCRAARSPRVSLGSGTGSVSKWRRKLEPNLRDAAGAGQGWRRCCSRGRYERRATFPAWSPPGSPPPVAPAARAAAPARRRAATRAGRSSPPPRSCSPNGAWAGRPWPRSPAGAVCSSRRSTTTSAARASCSTRSWARPIAPRSSWSTRVRAAGGSPAVQLYRVIRADVAALCALPYDLNEVHRLAARDRDAFARYWTEREQLVEALAGVVRAGVERRRAPGGRPATHRAHDDVERRGHAELAAGRRSRRCARVRPVPPSAHAVGAFLADLTVRGLLVAPRELDRVRRAADALDAAAAAG